MEIGSRKFISIDEVMDFFSSEYTNLIDRLLPAEDFGLGINPNLVLKMQLESRISTMRAALPYIPPEARERFVCCVGQEFTNLAFSERYLDAFGSEDKVYGLARTAMKIQDAMFLWEGNYSTTSHCNSVQEYSEKLAGEAGFTAAESADIIRAAFVHDTGKVLVPTRILRKPSSLTDKEFETMRRHPVFGAMLFYAAGATATGALVESHHIHYDGSGYPATVTGSNIDPQSEYFGVLPIADAFSAMTEDRPYRRGIDPFTAMERIRQNSGTQFHPKLVEVADKTRCLVGAYMERESAAKPS